MKSIFLLSFLMNLSFLPIHISSGSHLCRFISTKSSFVHMRSKPAFPKTSLLNTYYTPLYLPKNENQKKYVDYLNDYKRNIILGVGPAGTGKTLFACSHAITELKAGNIDKIVLTRPVVPVEEDIGYLPGNLVSKMDPWTRPIMDIFQEYYSKMEIDTMVKSNIIEISPLAYMRGRTFKRCIIIADEMQNCSPNQMFMIATRIGEHSKMIITGDLNQSDRGKENGLYDFLSKIKNSKKILENIALVEFENGDIERSEIVRTIMELYKPLEKETKEEKPEEKCDEILYPVVYNNTSTNQGEPEAKFRITDEINDAALIPRSLYFSKYIK